ncbi:MAG TPA: DNA-binding protein WhiA [Ruminococcus sp.]|nr:DNA-binding protein WhiA [Ruminococcus sp.]
MASFSNAAKTEICGNIRTKEHRSFLTGILLAARRFSADEIVLQTECEAFAAMLPKLMQTAGVQKNLDTEYRGRTGRQAVWSFTLSGKQAVSSVLAYTGMQAEDRTALLNEMGGNAFAAAMAGCFVLCGSVTDPERGYHLELVFPDEAAAGTIRSLLTAYQPTICMKSTQRKGDTILYLKQNEQICDALTFFGAPNASMSMAEQQVYKSIRSQTNRRTNCDLANIDKTVTAGAQQVADIQKIAREMGLDCLPATLQEIAKVRLAEPEANLRDLGAMCNPPLSRSGVHHRLQRISEIAKKLP